MATTPSTGVSYGCPCGKHVGHAPDAAAAIAALDACPGPAPVPARGRGTDPVSQQIARTAIAKQAARRRR